MKTGFTSIEERRDHFVAHFKSVTIEVLYTFDMSEEVRALVEEFRDVVVDKCQRVLYEDEMEYRIYGATKLQGIGDEFHLARSFIFQIVEMTECRLLNCNSVAGLSLNEITRHFAHEDDTDRPYCFVWRLPLRDMREKFYVPTEEEIKRNIDENEKWERMREQRILNANQ